MYINLFFDLSDIRVNRMLFSSHGGEVKMAIESVKTQMQFQDIQKTSGRPVDQANTSNHAELKSAKVISQGSVTGSADIPNEEEDQSQVTSESRIKSAVKHANNQMKHAKTRCEFSYHEQTKRVSIRIIDRETQEVIREVPPEETLEMVEKMWELAGILVDERR